MDDTGRNDQKLTVYEFGIEEILRYLLRNWLLIGIVVVLCVAAGVLWLKIRPVEFEARVTILPEGGAGAGGLVGQLADFTNIGGGSQGSFEEQYGKILVSDTVLDRLISRKWAGGGTDSLSLYQLLGFDQESVGQNSALSRFRLRQVLRQKCIAFKSDKETGLMTLAVRVPRDAGIAAELANELIVQLEDFVRAVHRQKFQDQHRYLAARLAEVKDQQDSAALAVAEFELANRGFGESPELFQQHGALERELQAVTAVWIELRRQLEVARIEETKESIGPRVLDKASPPPLPSSPSLIIIVIVSSFLGCCLGVAFALSRDLFQRLRKEVNE